MTLVVARQAIDERHGERHVQRMRDVRGLARLGCRRRHERQDELTPPLLELGLEGARGIDGPGRGLLIGRQGRYGPAIGQPRRHAPRAIARDRWR